MENENTIPRRNYLQLMTIPERSIRNAIVEVESIGASEELTMAITKLNEAFNLVADVFDHSAHAENMNFNFKGAPRLEPEVIDENWTKPANSKISVPDVLVPIFKKIGTHVRFHTISGKNEVQTIADITDVARRFFRDHPEALGK